MERVIAVHGRSMAPYLKDHDLLRVVELPSLAAAATGDLLLVERADSGDRVVHRVLAAGEIKGDRVKQADGIPGGADVRVLGKVTGRARRARGNRFDWISYERPAASRLHRLQAALSNANRWERPLGSKIAVALLIVVGRIARFAENHLDV